MTTDYKKTKEDVLKVYESFLRLIEIAKDRKDRTYDTSLVSLQKQAEKIKQDRFLLMVVGESNSGKSTFINAYLGEEILPMDVKQCTSAIVEIRYGEKFVLKATYADDKVKTITNKQEIRDFLIANAALDDDYRDIPVPAINNEILMKKKGEKVLEPEIKDLLKGIQNDNVHRLTQKEYEERVRQYIKKKQPEWRTIVKKIEIEYPFPDVALKEVVIVDSPGVNADGRVGNITNEYIEKADALMFLKSAAGQTLESASFRRFFESKSADRNKNAIFWILTRRASLTKFEIEATESEAVKQCPFIGSERIILLDSKVKLFYNRVQGLLAEEIKKYITELEEVGKLDDFVTNAWNQAKEDRDNFLRILKERSNFNVMDDALNRFAHKALYIMLNEFLERMLLVMNNVADDIKKTISYYEKKAENPKELANKMKHIKEVLDELILKINIKVESVGKRYSKIGGLIDQTADAVVSDYLAEINEIKPGSLFSVDELEKITFRKTDRLEEFQDELQKKIVADCDNVLVELDDKSTINYSTIKPDLTKEIFDKIKEEKRNSDESYETKTYKTGATFKKIETKSTFSQSRFFDSVKKSILERIYGIQEEAVADLRRFVTNTITAYKTELTRNKDIKKKELDAIVLAKQTAEEIQCTINTLNDLLCQLNPMNEYIKGLKGGIEYYV